MSPGGPGGDMFMTVAHFYKFVKIHKKMGSPLRPAPPTLGITHNEYFRSSIIAWFTSTRAVGSLLQKNEIFKNPY